MDVALERVQLAFELDAIIDVQVSNNMLYLAVGANTLIRVDLEEPSVIVEAQIDQGLTIDRIFTDLSGTHLIVVAETCEHFYLHKDAQKFRPLSKLNSIRTASILWNPLTPTRSPGPIMLISKEGTFHQAFLEVGAVERYIKRDVRYLKPLYKHGSRISGAHLSILPDGEAQLLAVSNQELCVWRGPLGDESSSLTYNRLFTSSPRLFEIGGKANTQCSGLRISSSGKYFCAFSDGTCLYGKVVDVSMFNSLDLDARHVVMSQYHILAFDDTHVKLYSLISGKQVTEIDVNFSDDFQGVATDTRAHTLWIFNEGNLYEIKVIKELEDVWRYFVDQGDFEQALSIAPTPTDKHAVFAAHGAHELSKKNWVQAAQLYGKSSSPIESVALELLDNNAREALLELFKTRLAHTRNKAQQTALSTWVVELLLQLDMKNDCKEFLSKCRTQLDVDSVSYVLSRHADKGLIVDWSVATGKFEAALEHLVSHQDWNSALKVLREHDSECLDLFYKYGTLLLKNSPKETVATLMRVPALDATRLLPGLIEFSLSYRGTNASNPAIIYLRQVCASRDSPQSLCDGLVSVLCLGDSEDELVKFIKERAYNWQDYDTPLRTCLFNGKLKAAIYLYGLMGLVEDAIFLALQHDLLDEAINIAESVPESDPLYRPIWLSVARCVAHNRPPQAILELADHIKAQDLLDLLPNFDTLEELAPEITKALESANNQLGEICREMDDSLRASQSLQEEVSKFKKRYVLVEPGEPCFSCMFPLQTRNFIMFPCQHGFHRDCLIKSLTSPPNIKPALANALENQADDKVVTELITGQCILCNEARINTITAPIEVEW